MLFRSGIDGSPEIGIKAVSEGVIDATFLYPTEGELVFRIAMAVLKGDKYERLTTIVPLSPVDRSNADILLAQYRLINSEAENSGEVEFGEIELAETIKASVSEREYEMLRDYYLNGYNSVEVADKYGIDRGTIRMRISRLKKKLKEHIVVGWFIFLFLAWVM